MGKAYRWLLYTLLFVAAGWTALTVWVEREGPEHIWRIAVNPGQSTALVVYDPDPIYNLDEQLCRSFAQGLAEGGIATTLATVRATNSINIESFDLFVFFSNTYNWRPDWAITGFIRHHASWKGKQVVAVTLGSGSTGASQKYFEKVISESGGSIIESRSFWLMRPNDETQMNESNVVVADTIVHQWALEVAKLVNQ